jgi:uncharacterized protein involved in exopolysaccharide biosynthesis
MTTDDDDEIDLRRLAWIVWRRRRPVAAFTACATGLAIAYALLATQWYRAEAVLIPRENRPGTGIAAQLAQFGGLSELAGIGLGQGDKQEPVAVLRSKGFARRFIQQNNLADELAKSASGIFSFNTTSKRDLRKIVDWFVQSALFIREDKKTGLVTIAVEWKDADKAADWANQMTTQLNHEMQVRALQESARNIAYLREQLRTTDSVYLQQAVAKLLESEMQTTMMARGTDQYSFRVVDEAQPPVRRDRPKRTLIVLLALVGSFLLAAMTAVLLDSPKAARVAR